MPQCVVCVCVRVRVRVWLVCFVCLHKSAHLCTRSYVATCVPVSLRVCVLLTRFCILRGASVSVCVCVCVCARMLRCVGVNGVCLCARGRGCGWVCVCESVSVSFPGHTCVWFLWGWGRMCMPVLGSRAYAEACALTVCECLSVWGGTQPGSLLLVT